MDYWNFLLTITLQIMVKACPPQQGTCYSGSASLSSRYGGNIVSRRCAETANRDWCAVSYYPHTDIANFGCANEFSLPFGSATCGDGAGSINQQGCSMVKLRSDFLQHCAIIDPRSMAIFARKSQALRQHPQACAILDPLDPIHFIHFATGQIRLTKDQVDKASLLVSSLN